MYEINTFGQRYDLTKVIEDQLPNLFKNDEVEIIPFGVGNIGKESEALKKVYSNRRI